MRLRALAASLLSGYLNSWMVGVGMSRFALGQPEQLPFEHPEQALGRRYLSSASLVVSSCATCAFSALLQELFFDPPKKAERTARLIHTMMIANMIQLATFKADLLFDRYVNNC